MPGWSQNPFWADELEECSSVRLLEEGFSETPVLAGCSQSPEQQQHAPPPPPKKGSEKKTSKASDTKKRTTAKKTKPQAKPRDTTTTVATLSSSDSDDDIPATQPQPAKRKRPAQVIESEEEADKTQKPVRAATLRSFLTQRGATGFTTQRDPTKIGEYFIELRVYNSREAERLSRDERWKNALTTLKTATDTNTAVWRAVAKLVQVGKEDFAKIQPIMYPSSQS